MTTDWTVNLLSVPHDGMDPRDPEALLTHWHARCHDGDAVPAQVELERLDLAEIARVGRDPIDVLDEVGNLLLDGSSYLNDYLAGRPDLGSLHLLNQVWIAPWDGDETAPVTELDAAARAVQAVQEKLGFNDEPTGLACPYGTLRVEDLCSGRWRAPYDAVWFLDIAGNKIHPVTVTTSPR